MLLSLNWLKEFIKFDLSPDNLAHRLIMTGIEVEQITTVGHEWDNIFVGEIINIAPHPQADKLTVPTIQVGNKTYSVVCGAPNIIIGQKVPLALDGAQLPSGIKIKTSKIRGAISQGMLCSKQELALGDDSSGIMILPDDSQVGSPLAHCLQLADTIFDLNITPNRPDCLSIIGLAREISAILDIPFAPSEESISESGEPIEQLTSVEIRDADLCPRYTARIISQITIGPSPLWMRRRLETSGFRSINNAVDVTNYVLLEYGQPLHAFDFDLLSGLKIVVKRAGNNERFVTLDGNEHTLTSEALMICDDTQSVAIGGIMGGQNSEVNPSTTRILLESAYFLPASIRKTSRATGLKTEASQRFEKGIDINGVIPALNRAASLISKLCGGTIATGLIDRYPNPVKPPAPLHLDVTMAHKVMGSKLTAQDMKQLLQRLHMVIESSEDKVLSVNPPSFRIDIQEPIDLIEEIARLNGYEHIPQTYPQAQLFTVKQSKNQSLTLRAREIMVSRGFFEVINYSFIHPSSLEHLKFLEHDRRLNPSKILNPLSEAQSVLRTTLIPSLLLNLSENLRHKNNTVKLFEISSVFLPDLDAQLPQEQRRIAGLSCGLRFGEGWDLPDVDVDLYDIKGYVETLLIKLNITSFQYIHETIEPFLHPLNCLSVIANGFTIGYLGEVHPEVLENFEIEKFAYIFDLNFDLIIQLSADKKTQFQPFPRHPTIYRDLALITDEQIEAETVRNAIISFKNKLVAEVTLFDCYRGSSLPPGKKSLAYRIKFQSQNRTLTDEEVNKIQEKLVSHLFNKVGAELRH